MEKQILKLGTTGQEGFPEIGEDYNYHGRAYKVVDIEPTGEKIRYTDKDGHEGYGPTFYIVLEYEETPIGGDEG